MSTKVYTFKGPVRWAKVWPGQVDKKFQTPQAGGNWSVIMNLDPDQTKLYNALGLRTKAVRLADPERGKEIGDVTFKRNERHPKLGELGSPAVLGVEDGTAIGNGSVCSAQVEVYTYEFEGTPGFASRLVSLSVDDLVEYKKDVAPVSATDGPPVF